ncbi:MAG: bifunctional diaminohydroxyphosphoribosylaminopyrimidine deaminase/5-amino-6-(5-phosphoribosylamino)uracil reductase RibD [Limnothrix sp. CACIAM 69d]|nr:MAG: bifunctional diaminohydroxyphosphoribosylaminopyrimidine deaminase/5-amino-6-(5-phosphoribosylamino)uracil reductase RibD [Limnothrix sp. CACIAM 69d]
MSEFVAVDAPAATEFDRAMMRRCLELARRALGRTAPNPMVGSVIVQGTEVVGEGFHPGAGQPHAEVFALRDAGDRARGATVYVSLEPCNHYGRTPPCSKALVEAGVAKVVIGTVDPNPQVAGQGIATLNAAGIGTLVGVERAACDRLNEPFFYRIQQGRPLGILKYAMTLDGKIATTHGHSAWVTDEQARAEVHRLRAGCDAVIVGGNTVRRDNPKLTSHGLDSHDPLRVVMTRRLDLPQTTADGRILHLWEPSEAPTLVLTLPGANLEMQAWLRDRGVEVQEVPNLSPARAIEVLNQRQFLSVLWECGGALSAQAIADGSVQKILAFIAPKIVGGVAAPSPVGDLGLTQMGDAIALERVTWRSVGQDFAIEGYLRPVQRTD